MRQSPANLLLIALAVAGLYACSSDEEPPSRDQYPVINARVYDLQMAVAERNRAGIDSLLAAEILKLGQSSDSLLSYIYGPERSRAFSRFDIRSFVQTDKLARVDCHVIDTAGLMVEPSISLTFQLYDDSLWLLKRFDPIPDDALSETDTSSDSL